VFGNGSLALPQDHKQPQQPTTQSVGRQNISTPSAVAPKLKFKLQIGAQIVTAVVSEEYSIFFVFLTCLKCQGSVFSAKSEFFFQVYIPFFVLFFPVPVGNISVETYVLTKISSENHQNFEKFLDIDVEFVSSAKLRKRKSRDRRIGESKSMEIKSKP